MLPSLEAQIILILPPFFKSLHLNSWTIIWRLEQHKNMLLTLLKRWNNKVYNPLSVLSIITCQYFIFNQILTHHISPWIWQIDCFSMQWDIALTNKGVYTHFIKMSFNKPSTLFMVFLYHYSIIKSKMTLFLIFKRIKAVFLVCILGTISCISFVLLMV